jgi:hypothetical protein
VAAWILGTWVLIPFNVWMFVLVFFVLCCPLKAGTSRRTDLTPKKPYQVWYKFIILEVILIWYRPQGLIRKADNNNSKREDDPSIFLIQWQ